MDRLKPNIEMILSMMRSPKSFAWETKDNFKDTVCKPIIDYPMAPREAYAILTIFGELKASGVDIWPIVRDVVERDRWIFEDRK